MSLSRNMLVWGRETLPESAVQLRAGGHTALFEPATGWLRSIRLGQVEVLRAIYGAVRDCNWGTVTPQISNLQVEQKGSSFSVTFDVRCHEGEIEFDWHGVIGGTEDEITFSFDGRAGSTFLRNRIGLCVLHPIRECVGQPCVIEAADGVRRQSQFPDAIAPHQPFKNLRAMTHEVLPGLQAEVRFDGEVFETEDQRNWTDASFKTYGTPLELPFPVSIEKGARVRQTVSLRLAGYRTAPGTEQQSDAHIHLTNLRPVRVKPSIGFGMASHGQGLTAGELERLKRLRPEHLRVDLQLAGDGWRKALEAAVLQAQGLGTSLHTAIFLPAEPQAVLKDLAATVGAMQAPVSLWLVFQEGMHSTPIRALDLAREHLSSMGPEVPFAAGTNANLAELNRARLPGYLDVLPCFSINPQVHAFDDLSVFENLEGQGEVINSAFAFARAPVVVSPITLRPRFNAVATGEAGIDPEALPPQVDPRQLALNAAAWTLGSLAQTATNPNVHSVTYYETTGWRGVMEQEKGSDLPAKFPSVPGMVFPMYFVFAWLAECQQVARLAFSGRGLEGIAGWDEQNKLRLLVANVGAEERAFTIEGSRSLRVRMLDMTNVERAISEPEQFETSESRILSQSGGMGRVRLPAYAIARID